MSDTLDNLVIDRPLVYRPDGTVELAVRVLGPLPSGAIDALVPFGGEVDGDDVVLARTWSVAMVPVDPRAAMREAITSALTAWATSYAGPVAAGEPGDAL